MSVSGRALAQIAAASRHIVTRGADFADRLHAGAVELREMAGDAVAAQRSGLVRISGQLKDVDSGRLGARRTVRANQAWREPLVDEQGRAVGLVLPAAARIDGVLHPAQLLLDDAQQWTRTSASISVYRVEGAVIDIFPVPWDGPAAWLVLHANEDGIAFSAGRLLERLFSADGADAAHIALSDRRMRTLLRNGYRNLVLLGCTAGGGHVLNGFAEALADASPAFHGIVAWGAAGYDLGIPHGAVRAPLTIHMDPNATPGEVQRAKHWRSVVVGK